MCDTWRPKSETEVECKCSDEHVVVAILFPMMLEKEGSLVMKLLSFSFEWFSWCWRDMLFKQSISIAWKMFTININVTSFVSHVSCPT